MTNTSRRLPDLIAELDPVVRARMLRVEDPQGWADRLSVEGGRVLTDAGPTDLAFCKAATPALLEDIRATRSKFLVVPPAVIAEVPDLFVDRVAIVSDRPRLLMAALLARLSAEGGVAHQRESIHPAATIASDVTLGPGVVIGRDVTIGVGCVIGPNTVIDHCTIGTDTRIGPNCSIGGEGFGFEIDEESGETFKFPHVGRVHIGSRVEVCANVCIARGSLKDTILEDDVKVDNFVHVAHNCHVRRSAFLIAHTMLGGSVEIGHHAWIAPSSAIMNGLQVGACAMTGLGAVVTKPVEANDVVAGVPAKRLRHRFDPDSPLLGDV